VVAMTLTERLLHETVTHQSELSEFRRTQRGGRLPHVSKSGLIYCFLGGSPRNWLSEGRSATG
jgi:hypothetical protein